MHTKGAFYTSVPLNFIYKKQPDMFDVSVTSLCFRASLAPAVYLDVKYGKPILLSAFYIASIVFLFFLFFSLKKELY